MRFMMLVHVRDESGQAYVPTAEQADAMSKYNDSLSKAGVLLSAEGLHPTAKGAMVKFGPGGSTKVTDGPFSETKELVGGYWLIEVSSKEEAVEWARRVPFDDGDKIEIRQVFEAAEFDATIAR
jgi:hypothetical protein